MIDCQKCEECGKEFISCDRFEKIVSEEYVKEQMTCSIIEGDYCEWYQVKCPECGEIVAEYGKY